MTLQEIFEQLSGSEFSQLSIGGASQGVIDESNYARVLPMVNLGLTKLYTRFNLKQGRLVLTPQAGKYTYQIASKFDSNNMRSREPVKYLANADGSLFQDDLLKIEQVRTSAGFELGLNDAANPWSILTPSVLTMRVPAGIVDKPMDLPDQFKTTTLEVVYRANHPKIAAGLTGIEPEMVQVQLPDSHLEALLMFIAARMTAPTGMSVQDQTSNTFYAKYEAVCQALENAGLQVDQGSQVDKLRSRGFV
jgi:hypothetical protein